LVERVVRDAAGPRATVLRRPAVFGPDDRQRRLLPVLERIDDGRPALVLGETDAQWRFTHGYVEDVADAIVLAAIHDAAVGRTYNLGPTDTPTQAEMAEWLAAVAGWHGRVVTVPDDALPSPPVDFRQHMAADTTRIRHELGYAYPTGL